MDDQINIYLEIGTKKVFAGAVEWPGWCRVAKDESSALHSLAAYAARYARVLEGSTLHFRPPADASRLTVVERLNGNASTDFGAPDMAPSADSRPVSIADLGNFQALLAACWKRLDEVAEQAQGKELHKGPRGGGRELGDVLRHVVDAERGYLSRLAWKADKASADLQQDTAQTRQAVLEALDAAVKNGLPEAGPRGGKIWQVRYFLRREAWHLLDHVWELEDRIL